MSRRVATLFASCFLIAVTSAGAVAQQWTPDKPGSDNIEVVAHLPLGPALSTAEPPPYRDRAGDVASLRVRCS